MFLEKNDTPTRRQYNRIKSQYPNSIIAWEVDGYYHILYDDVKIITEAFKEPICTSMGFSKDGLHGLAIELFEKGYTVTMAERLVKRKDNQPRKPMPKGMGMLYPNRQ